ncbi:MAG: acyl-CoA thioesterase [Aquificaceae bacterium]
MDKIFSYSRRVQFYETDAQGVVHHSNYFRYFEEARGELLRSLGFPYSRLREEGYEVVLLSIQCDFLKPLYYEEEFRVDLKLSHINRFTFSFEYLLSSLDILRAKGYTRHCLLKDGKVVSLPKDLREKISLFFSDPYKH